MNSPAFYGKKENMFLPSTSQRRRIVSKEARKLSKEHARTSNLQTVQNDWFRAEESVDSRILSQNLTPAQAYGALMSKFYSSLDGKDLTPSYVERAFLEFLRWNWKFVERAAEIGESSHGLADFRNLSIITDDDRFSADYDPLSLITKRAILLADTTMITSSSGRWINLFSTEHNNYYEIFHDYSTPIPNNLGEWLLSCRSLLENGDIIYLPTTITVHETVIDRVYDQPHPAPPRSIDVSESRGYIHQVLQSSRKATSFTKASPIDSPVVRAIAHVELPYLAGVDLQHFAKISCDEHDRLEVFRNYLRRQFLILAENEGNEHFDKNLTKIGLEIEKDITALKRDFRLLTRKTGIQAVNATVATVTATLAVIYAHELGQFASLLAAGGGLGALLKIIGDLTEQRSQIKEEPFYYLWLLNQG